MLKKNFLIGITMQRTYGYGTGTLPAGTMKPLLSARFEERGGHEPRFAVLERPFDKVDTVKEAFINWPVSLVVTGRCAKHFQYLRWIAITRRIEFVALNSS